MNDWPGKEIGDPEQRAIAQRLVREQGWGYRKPLGGGHSILYPPNGTGQVWCASTPGEGRGHANWLAELKRNGADLSTERQRRTVTPRFQPAGVEEQIIAPWSDREWREMQRESEHWWRQLLAPPEQAPEPEPEPTPEPEPARLTDYAQGLLSRIESAAEPRPNARGAGPLADARRQVKDGYSIATVSRRTGWGRMWLQDLEDRAS
jgi:hypothetical protein